MIFFTMLILFGINTMLIITILMLMLTLMFNLYHSALTVARNCGRPVDSEMYSAESSKNLTEFISIFILITLTF